MSADSVTSEAQAPPSALFEVGDAQARRRDSMATRKGAFVVGCTAQTEWGWLIATAFFLGKIGAGLFVVSILVGSDIGMLLGILIAVVGKGVTHLLYLGRWERFWRILANPGSSWIARGFWAIVVFFVFGLIYVAPAFGLTVVPEGSAAWYVVGAIASLAAFVVMFYDGFVLNASSSIPLWNTSVMPVLCLSYSLLGGTSLSLALLTLTDGGPIRAHTLETMEIGLIVVNIVIVVMFLSSVFTATSAAKQSAIALIRGKYAFQFLGLAVFIGLIVTLVLALLFMNTANVAVLALAAAADLVGHFSMFFLLLRAGLFARVM